MSFEPCTKSCATCGQALADVVYMDHAATTPLRPDVWAAISHCCHEYYGNPSTMYSVGSQCEEAVEAARGEAAAAINAKPEEVYFTSGGTESDNWAIKGVALRKDQKGKHIIISSVEHHAVLEPCHFLERLGFEATLLPVDKYGLVDPDDLCKAIRDNTLLISVMHANNEVGTIEPVEEIGRIAKERGIPFHVDAVQTVGKIPDDVEEIQCDLLSISAHKLGGPKGIGALYLRKGTKIESFMHGGGQERGKRAGTHNVPGIIALGKAAKFSVADMPTESERIRALRDRLQEGILDRVADVRLNGHPTRRLPGHLNISVAGVEGEAMILCLDMNRICVSSGSACTTGSLDPSHVLLAMGLPPEVAHGSLRFTLGRSNTEEQIDYVLEVLPPVVERLRKMSPTYSKA